MKKVLLCVAFLASSLSFSNTVKIVDIIDEQGDFLVLASDGLVYELLQQNNDKKEFAYEAMNTNESVELVKPKLSLNKFFDVRQKIIDFKGASTEIKPKSSIQKINKNSDIEASGVTPLDGYQVSAYSTEAEGLKLFKSMRTDTRKKSQCYNRAHVWSYEMNKKMINGKRIQLGKTWLFFSRKYIREYKYKWWFHIAPYLKQKDIKDDIFVMDRKFTRKPLRLKDWTDVFMHNDAECSEVKFYSDYRSRMYTEECFIINSSMYYWQPNELKKLEETGLGKSFFRKPELQTAYKNGIKRRNRGSLDF